MPSGSTLSTSCRHRARSLGAHPSTMSQDICLRCPETQQNAAGGIRTHTPFRTRPFEGPASTVPPPPHASPQCMRERASGRVRRWVGRIEIGDGGRVPALELDVPALLEAAHREGDEQHLNGTIRNVSTPSSSGVQVVRSFESGFVALEPAGAGDEREDASGAPPARRRPATRLGSSVRRRTPS